MHCQIRQAYKSFLITSSLSSASDWLGWLCVRSNGCGWPVFSPLLGQQLAVIGSVGLSESCGEFFPRILRIAGLLDG